MRWVAIAAALATIPASAEAGYISSRTYWDALNQSQKNGYVMGALDQQLMLFTTDSPAEMQSKLHKLNCLRDLKMGSAQLSKLVDEGYAADATFYSYSPTGVLMGQVAKVCDALPQKSPLRK